MVNTKLIKSRMIMCEINQSDLANELKISQTAVNQKINNARKTSIEEALKMQKILGIEDKEFETYFAV